MAQRRMFSLKVVDTDKFLNMPSSAQALYFHLGMRADDDGFVSSPRRITALVGSATDDLTLLVTKGFIIPFESGIVVMTHWKQNNYIQADRYNKTIYTKEKALLSADSNGDYLLLQPDGNQSADGLDTKCIQNLSISDTQVRLGKDNNIYTSSLDDGKRFHYRPVVESFNRICVSLPKVKNISDPRKTAIKKAASALEGEFSFEEFFEKVESSDFLTGRSGGFKGCGFDWIMKPANLTKIIEGNYDNRDGSGKLQGVLLEGGAIQL